MTATLMASAIYQASSTESSISIRWVWILSWLCPVYDSPNADNGYDIADYRSIAEEFGGMSDWKALVEELHGRGCA